MPVYEYKCTECQQHFDVEQSFTDDALTEMDGCETDAEGTHRLKKVFSAVGISFKGDGFYRNDARSSGSKSSAASSNGSSESLSKSDGGSDSSSSSGKDDSSSSSKSTTGSSSAGSSNGSSPSGSSGSKTSAASSSD